VVYIHVKTNGNETLTNTAKGRVSHNPKEGRERKTSKKRAYEEESGKKKKSHRRRCRDVYGTKESGSNATLV